MDTTPTRPHLTPHRPSTLAGSNLPAPFDPSVVTKYSVHTLIFRSLKRTHDLFISNQGDLPPVDLEAEKILLSTKAKDYYSSVLHLFEDNQVKSKKKYEPMDTGDNNQVALFGPALPPPSGLLCHFF